MSTSSLSNKKRRILLPLPSPESSNVATEKVEGNDDILVNILVRLPARFIFRFRCVSKRWKNLISTPFFLQTHYNIRKAHRRVIAYIQQSYSPDGDMNMLPVPPSNDHNIDTSIRSGLYLSSSNGLIICESGSPVAYHIINPLTRKSVLLPPLKVLKYPDMALMCEENARDLVLNYKVIAAGGMKGNTLVIETFSSKTCEWTTSKLTATGSLDKRLQRRNTLVVDGIIHWYIWYTHVAIYDSNQDKTEPSVQLIQLPSQSIGNQGQRVARSSRDDPLWLCVDIMKCVRIWMLPNTVYGSYRKQSATIPEREWMLMHSISYQPLCKTIFREVGETYPSWENWVSSTQLAGLVPWELPLVALLKINSRLIYRCNLVNKTFEQVQYRVTPTGFNSYVFFPYMEALSLSSYGL